ncbi:hypothetical protein lerEdw1_015182 [Lerista edwardsae]|nr:hypothetical protein lerEdw1_015184 [Lerista edwardsae]KAJ6612570.1 hypothetical protein lerEdw1_015182 [Lerista edwardsae]
MTVLSLSTLFGIYKREEKARLQGGLLVKSIIDTLSNAAHYPERRKLVAYSAVSIFLLITLAAVQLRLVYYFLQHDTTLGALQIALNIYNERLPPYAACQIFELYKEDNGQVYYCIVSNQHSFY